MKKNVLSAAVACVLSGVMLTACGGGGDEGGNGGNSGGGTDTGSKPLHTAIFLDAAVAGLNYRCANYSSITNANGEFLFNDGDSCSFTLGNQLLGSVTLKAGSSLVTPYTLAGDDKNKAIRIAALLQTLDSDNNPENGITLDTALVAQLGIIELGSDDAFNTSLVEALKTAGLTKDVVSLAAAKDHLSATLAGVNGRSVAVDKVLSDLQALTDLKNLDVESKLKDYKGTLQAETTESGKVDRQIVLAMLSMLEVTNNPVVAERLGFVSSSVGSGYSSNLAKVIDVIIHTPGTASVALKGGKGYTHDVAQLMGAYADSMEKVAATLADIQDPDYSATYGDDESVTLNFDGAKALRASAMAMASALNIAASYQYGPDNAYATQEEEVTLPRMHIKQSWGMQLSTTYEESASTFKAQFSQLDIEPDTLVNHADFFRLTDDAKVRLGKAKAQLKDAVSLALTVDQGKLDESLTQEEIEANTATLKQLADHFSGKVATIQWENTETKYVNTDMGWEPQNVGVKYNINVLPFFDEMLDRSDVAIKVAGACAGSVGERDAELSKAMGMPMCLISSNEFKTLAENDRGALEYIGWMQEDQDSYTTIYAKGVSYDWSTQMTPLAGSTFDKIFVSCTDLDGNKVSCADQL
ncbi:TPA: hypothetical protein PKO72_003252 [Aeromonas hydrophila]|uniref:hypothetical protein n=1 Tax=Aeromonas TaxID=642 RepID=UPI000B2EE0F1|nr:MULTISPECIES: hypothetical protein [Aeromonas]HEB4994916.1 hypothetical protein [Aeromonas hydrophila subsp. hydrophila]UBQ52493.1 hypothetical protein LCH17_10590 [Aeromonas hydrophila]BBT08683.1 hypothetical protein WP7S18E06_41820 [Aeromonas hydrophila]HDI1214480.1 hypothetical protein [Aeromonas hydrophila]HEB5045103.1 hypothetical protein [Aeromonas hydrophila subsp. hydrophila]